MRLTKESNAILEWCMASAEKGSELMRGDPGRKWKGRYVFRGNDVKDEHMQAAIFNELSSTPAT
eukprot:4280785-Heterocapsa_arctica.AAC.1